MAMKPEELPIYRYEQDIVRALTDHRVLVLEGPTGSGKTTQLPKILQRAMVTDGVIGITQPRRIAAVSVAWRVADELGVQCGTSVGYAIRFDDQTSSETRIKIMTDGILLQEARSDPEFSRYAVIVVDEAHERTLNIDVTLGLLHRALSRRPDLRVVVSSATLQPLLFQKYFQSVVPDVPVVSIDARPYPVEIVYRPARSEDNDAIIDAAAEEITNIVKSGQPGHILTFLAGEAAIKHVYDRLLYAKLPREVALLPLYGKLTRSEQERVFDELPTESGRKVVLATNIAETSITVPGVCFVIDSGLAKVPRFNSRTSMSTLFEEGISKASADQRAGRAGRTSPGRCIRLYSKKQYLNRPDFTDEEILRLDLTEVVLRLIDLGVKDVETFPLPTPPKRRAIEAALAMLQSMNAIDRDREVTPIGRKMMAFPLSPPLARMVVEAIERFPRAIDPVIMVAAFLSAHSPYLYPQGEEAEARRAQAVLAQPTGDAMTAVATLSRYLATGGPEGFCKLHYLDPDVMAFIKKAHRQLRDIATGLGVEIGPTEPRVENDAVVSALVVRCVATGFAHQILRAHGRVYQSGAGDTSAGEAVSIHPSSSLFGERAQYIVATEVVISTRAYARNCTALRPEVVADVAPELARAWHITVARKKKFDVVSLPKEAVPQTILVAGVHLGVEDKRGKILVAIEVRDAARLARADLANVPRPFLSMKAELRAAGGGIWGRPMALAKWLALLPHLPLTTTEAPVAGDLPVGALLEIDRNLHTLARFVGRVLEPVAISRGRQAGWVALVSNGEGGFWFELVADWGDVVDTTLGALRDLHAALPATDQLAVAADKLIEDLEARQSLVEEAYGLAKRLGGGPRQG